MPTEAVVDSSVITAIATLEEHSNWAAKKIAEHEHLHILDLSYYEVANAIRYKTTDQFNVKDAAKAFTQAVEIMDLFNVHSFNEIVAESMAIAFDLNITVYDAAFLSLADKIDMHLLTLDIKLVKKLEKTKYFGLIEYPNKTKN